jgi:hypothetical protein
MEITYNRDRLSRYEKRVQAGTKLAERAEIVGDRCRRTGKNLKVVSFPQRGQRVPSIRVAGKWLERFGFVVGDEVILAATEGRILITKKEGKDYGNPVV